MNRHQRFRETRSATDSWSDEQRELTGRGSISAAGRAVLGYGRSSLLLAGIWLLGLVALASIITFERRLDNARRAQVVVAEMRNQQSALIRAIFAPVVAGRDRRSPAETSALLEQARSTMSGSVERLNDLVDSGAPERIGALTEGFYAFAERLSVQVASGATP